VQVLWNFCQVCKAKTVEQRAKIPGLPEKRADVIVGGAVLLEEIFLAMGIQKMKVSPFALREGVIVDTLAETYENYQPGFNIRSSSIMNLALKFNTDRRMKSAQHSSRLAKVRLFPVEHYTNLEM
jgi:exopolyphosphatase/guanosine-5'-triphosphate,3'-diphosphate pyrophosphatase